MFVGIGERTYTCGFSKRYKCDTCMEKKGHISNKIKEEMTTAFLDNKE